MLSAAAKAMVPEAALPPEAAAEAAAETAAKRPKKLQERKLKEVTSFYTNIQRF